MRSAPRWKMAFAAVAVCAVLAVAGCSDDEESGGADAAGGNDWTATGSGTGTGTGTGAGTGTGPGTTGSRSQVFLGACATDGDCVSGFCLATKRCSRACDDASPCPEGGWECTGVEGSAAKACLCLATSEKDVCDGVDNDCDAVIDEDPSCGPGESCSEGGCLCPSANQCGPECTDLASDPFHCGGCDEVCGINEACVEGACTCAETCGGSSCLTTNFDSGHCGDCSTTCGLFEECVDAACTDIDREWAAWTPVASPGLSASSAGGVLDSVTGLTWTVAAADAPMTWADATAYCDSLDADANPPPAPVGDVDGGTPDAGSADGGTPTVSLGIWRLPTRIELLSLVDYTQPGLSTVAFPDAPTGYYWTSTVSAVASSKVWAVGFEADARYNGVAHYYEKAPSTFLVRCVR